MAYLAVFGYQSQLAIARSAIVADGGDIFRALLSQRSNEVVWKARAAESAEHDSNAVRNIGHGRIQARIDFLSHGTAYPTRGRASLAEGEPITCERFTIRG